MPKDWWKTYFDENYIFFWKERGMFRHTTREVNFVVKNIPIKKSDRILDLCCGHGRHSIEFAKRGYKVSGLDFSNYELNIARKDAKARNLDIDFRQGDARNFKYPKKFDVVLNMFTAFGYGTKEDDRKIIRSVSKSLNKGGKLFIDLLNFAWLIKNYQPYKVQSLPGVKVIMKRRFDFLTSIASEQRTVIKGKKRKTYRNAHRMYTLGELSDLFESEGLKVIKYWGSFKGKSYGIDTKRMLVLARKR